MLVVVNKNQPKDLNLLVKEQIELIVRVHLIYYLFLD